jgi:hypothetical protein
VNTHQKSRNIPISGAVISVWALQTDLDNHRLAVDGFGGMPSERVNGAQFFYPAQVGQCGPVLASPPKNRTRQIHQPLRKLHDQLTFASPKLLEKRF